MSSKDPARACAGAWPAVLACVLMSVSLNTSTSAQAPEEDARLTQEYPPDQPLSHREQNERYVWGTFGPPGLAGAALASAFQQWRDVPHEWGQTPTAYLQRFAAEYAESAVNDTTKYLVARLFDEDPRFRRCKCAGVLPRLRHASLAPFRAQRADGTTVFSIARIAGLTAGRAVAATTWYPAPQGAAGVLKHVSLDLAGKIGVDVLREFLPVRRR